MREIAGLPSANEPAAHRFALSGLVGGAEPNKSCHQTPNPKEGMTRERIIPLPHEAVKS